MDNTGLSLKGSISFDLKADVWEMRQRVKKLGHYPDTAIYLR